LRVRENHLEKLVRLATPEEARLIAVPCRRHSLEEHHAFDAERHHLVEERAHRIWIGTFAKSVIVVVTRKPILTARRTPSTAFWNVPCAANRKVVALSEAVHVDAEGEGFYGLKSPASKLFLEEQRVRAEVDVLPSRNEPLDDPLISGWSSGSPPESEPASARRIPPPLQSTAVR
jgi:hypothetical protein